MSQGAAIGFWPTVWLLLKTARRRAHGRRYQNRQMLDQQGAIDWGPIGLIFSFCVMGIMHGIAAYATVAVMQAGPQAVAQAQGKLVVSSNFIEAVRVVEAGQAPPTKDGSDPLTVDYEIEGFEMARDLDISRAEAEKRLKRQVAQSGSRLLLDRAEFEVAEGDISRAGPVGTIAGTLFMVLWFLMIVCQGEGLMVDVQRRRHPMWEWFLSHPVRPGAVFLAEMLTPISANPAYWAAPIYIATLYTLTQGLGFGLLAMVLIGVPLTIAAACLGKALEIGAMLRLPARSRGAVIGLLSWIGFALMFVFFIALKVMLTLAQVLAGPVLAADLAPSLMPALLLGQDGDGQFSLLRGMLFGWVLAALVIAAAVTFSARSIRNGLSGAFAVDGLAPAPARRARFGRDPLYRKEMLWFIRDRSAVVQVILIPLSVAALQLFNLRGLIEDAQESWNYLSGLAIMLGTYFLWVLGPKSLSSEGTALWISLTWPRGLESLLKAKAWLWSLIASGLVGLVLLYALWLFPHDFWKIGLIAIGWYAFSRSMAEKAVTLVSVPSESGEAQPAPAGRRWAAQLGMLSFAIGVITQQWQLAIVGIVYSWITAEAMWENLRARLPYLYDPWSEVLPPPPTLMHAMIAVTVLVECAAIMTGIFMAIGGADAVAVAMGLGYALCAIGVSIGMSAWLDGRGVAPVQIWRWFDETRDPYPPESWWRRYIMAGHADRRWLAIALFSGIALAGLAKVYLLGMAQIPAIGEMIEQSSQQMESVPGLAATYAVMAILFAPFAEEYLFRGLLYRRLDVHWGGWKAVLGAGAFFAIYHPALAWPPVMLVGIANCLLFKASRSLTPPILLHMSYNAVVMLMP